MTSNNTSTLFSDSVPQTPNWISTDSAAFRNYLEASQNSKAHLKAVATRKAHDVAHESLKLDPENQKKRQVLEILHEVLEADYQAFHIEDDRLRQTLDPDGYDQTMKFKRLMCDDPKQGYIEFANFMADSIETGKRLTAHPPQTQAPHQEDGFVYWLKQVGQKISTVIQSYKA